MQKKILSITVPTWNRAELLKELLSELIEQIVSENLQDKVELLVSNNGSSDATEAVVKDLKSRYNFITYNNNGVNKGARYNVIKCMELANAEYLMLFGDDDRPRKNIFSSIVNYLEANPNTGSLYDSHLFKKNPFGNAVISLTQLLEHFYYYLGNAGLFIIKSDYIKEVLSKHPYDFFSPTWPQTQIFILAAEHHPQDEIRIYDFNVLSAGRHAEMMIYTSYYLWRTTYFDLVEAVEAIRNKINTENYNSAKNYLKNNCGQLVLNILQCGVFLDDYHIRFKTAKHIFSSLTKVSFKEGLLFTIVAVILLLPTFISKPLSDLFILLTKGKSGLKKKNDFVKKETTKRFNKKKAPSDSVREFDFKNV